MKNPYKFAATLICVVALTIIANAQPASWASKGIGGGGALYSPSINPLNPLEMYVACDMSDLFHTTDGGANWNIVDFRQVVSFHLTKVYFTNNNLIRYTLTNDPVSGAYSVRKSTDGGTIWNTLGADPTGGDVWSFVANPQNSNQIIIGDYYNLYLSNDGGATFGASPFYTTAQGSGAYVAGSFFDGNNIYICTNQGLMVSTNGGSSWGPPSLQGIPVTEEIVSMSGSKQGNLTRFFCVTLSSGNVYCGITGDDYSGYQNVYTMDYGSNWVAHVSGILTASDRPFYCGSSATNTNIAYIGGADIGTGYPLVMKSTDGGVTWTHVFVGTGNVGIQTGYCGYQGDFGWTWPSYLLGFNVCDSDPNKVIFSDYGFLHGTTNGATSWQALYAPATEIHTAGVNTPQHAYYHNNGLDQTASWWLMWRDSLNMFSGYTDIHGIRSRDGGNSWAFDYTGLQAYNTVYMVKKNPNNSTMYAATSSVHDMYMSTRLQDNIIDAGSGQIMYSTDSGNTWLSMHNFAKPVIWMEIDPSNSNRMYASVINYAGSGTAGGIWVSNNIQNNATSTWTHLTNPTGTEGHPFNIHILNDGTIVSSWSGRRNGSGVFQPSSGVFISTDGGNTWIDRSDAGMRYWTMDIIVDPFDAFQNTWYTCVFSGWGGPPNGLGGLYRTTNRGVQWTRVNNTDRVYSLTFDPTHSGTAYMTTEIAGLLYTTNINAATPTFSTLTAYPFEHPSRVFFNPYNSNEVWICSFGNGLRMGSLNPTGIATLDFPKSVSDFSLMPNPGKEDLQLMVNIESKQKVYIYIQDAIGRETKVLFNNILNSGMTVMKFDLSNISPGIYFISVRGEFGSVSKKWIKL